MRSFCVECGREAEVFEGLCATCLPTKRRFLRLPDVVTLVRCPHCGRYQMGGEWREVAPPEAVHDAIGRATQVPRQVEGVTYTFPEEFGGDPAGPLEGRAHLTLGNLDLEEPFAIQVHVRGTTCPDCAKQQGEYYEAVLQIRAQERDVTAEEIALARAAITEKVESSPGLFVSREEPIHGGLDVYLSQNEAAKALAQSLRRRLGGQVQTAPKLHTRHQGRDVYRVTYALRLPRFAPGDVLVHEGRVYQVLGAGDPVAVRDLTTGARRSLSRRAAATARPLAATLLPGTLIADTGEEVQVMDGRDYRVRHVKKPPDLELEGEEVTLILTEEGDFIAPPVA